jgi:hypothetical protein
MGIPDWNEIEVDLNPGDGMRDTLSCWTQEEEYGRKSLALALNGNEYREENWGAFSVTAYLVCAEGNFYLCAEGRGENDYRTMYIYDLSGENAELVCEFSGAGFTGYWDEAAGIDGASPWQRFWHVTLPMLRPSVTICTFLTLTNGFKLFDQNLALTGGMPSGRSELLALNIYHTFYGRAGWEGAGQAKAVVFCVIVVSIAFLQLRLTQRGEVEA